MIQILVFAFSLAVAAVAPGTKDEEEVLAAMNAWKQAMLTRDRAALEAIYAPKLVYVHSNGKQENKTEAIDAVVNGTDRFESIDLSDIGISIYEKTATVKTKAVLRINNGTAINTLNLDILHVWVKMPSGWQMVARHALRLNPPN